MQPDWLERPWEERATPPNKGMKLTSVERIGRSQPIPGVLRTRRRCAMMRPARALRVLAPLACAAAVVAEQSAGWSLSLRHSVAGMARQALWVGVRNTSSEPRAVCLESWGSTSSGPQGIIAGHVEGGTHSCGASSVSRLVLPDETTFFHLECEPRVCTPDASAIEIRAKLQWWPEHAALKQKAGMVELRQSTNLATGR